MLTAQFSVGASQHFLGIDAAHAHRSQCCAEIDKVDAGYEDNQEPDTYQQSHGAAAACLEVVGRMHVIIQFLYRDNIEFLCP